MFHSSRVLVLVLLAANAAASSYEVWAPDQSNSVEGQDALGVKGSWLWIWDSEDLQNTLDTATTSVSKSCSPDAETGPCDLFTIFPGALTDSADANPLSDAPGFGRWHGITKDPQEKYVTANIFAPNGGFIGVVDTTTKEAVALFRVTEMAFTTTDATTSTARNVHMSFWNTDGSAILVHNLAGKALERINVERDTEGTITALTFDKSATVGFGSMMQVATEASYYEGTNAFGNPLMGGTTGSYDDADLGDLTPTGHCKENGCVDAANTTASPGRPNNVPICPVVGHNNMVFNTMGGGGLLVTDSTQTPMAIVGAYGNSVVYGAGVCGSAVGDRVYVTSGVSASGAGSDQSMFAVYAFDSAEYENAYAENEPAPVLVYDDETGTATGGKTTGNATNESGQNPGTTTRRDAHDLVPTLDGKYVHVVDRIQNVVEVFDSETDEHISTYDLATATGKIGDGTIGPCAAASVTDGGDGFPINDPAPDFIEPTPDGKYMVISFRGPAPVSAGHAAAGSCPGVGVVELLEGGASGMLVGVMRTSHTTPDNLDSIFPAGGAEYTGAERSDIHDLTVIKRGESGGEEDAEDDAEDEGDVEDSAAEDAEEDAEDEGGIEDSAAVSRQGFSAVVGVVLAGLWMW